MYKSPLEKEFALHLNNRTHPYFEGWYFKVQTANLIISIIVGIHIRNGKKEAFIQTLDTVRNISSYHTFEESKISIQLHPFQLQLDQNIISMNTLIIHTEDIHLDVSFESFTPIHKNLYSPTIMGPFSYLPMECIHSVISLHHKVHGVINIKNQVFSGEGIGYIEKDRGISFPKEYVWFQSNQSTLQPSCFFLSIATIPLSILHFQGCIGILMIKEKQYRFATYLGCRIQRFDYVIKEGHRHVFIRLKQGFHILNIHLIQGAYVPLKGPKNGEMNIRVDESITSTAHVELYHHKTLIEKLSFACGGCEIHEYPYHIQE